MKPFGPKLAEYVRSLQPEILINNRLGQDEDFKTPEKSRQRRNSRINEIESIKDGPEKNRSFFRGSNFSKPNFYIKILISYGRNV